jgi:hypothetical protein
MGLILWIDQNGFASSLIEKVFKKKDLPFYTIPHARDFTYLVDDLKPALIVIDASTALRDLDVFREQYEKSQTMKETPWAVIGAWTGLEFIKIKKGELPRTLDPFTVPDIVLILSR